MRPAKRFLLASTGKGGTGKTRFTTALDAYFRDRDLPFVGIDADLSNASYHRFSNKAEPIDVTSSEVDNWIEAHVLKHLIQTSMTSLIIDTGAGTERNLREWLANNEVIGILQERNIEVIMFSIFDSSIDSVTAFLENADVLPDARHVLVFNEGLTKGISSKKAFKSIESEPEFMEHAKGKPRIYMPALLDAHQIDRTDYPIYDSQAAGSELARNPMFVRRIQLWKRSMYEQIEKTLDGDMVDAGQFENTA